MFTFEVVYSEQKNARARHVPILHSSHLSAEALGIKIPEVIGKISRRALSRGSYYSLRTTRGRLLPKGKADVLAKGAILVAAPQLVYYEYLNNKEFGYPTTTWTDDNAAVILTRIKVRPFSDWRRVTVKHFRGKAQRIY